MLKWTIFLESCVDPITGNFKSIWENLLHRGHLLYRLTFCHYRYLDNYHLKRTEGWRNMRTAEVDAMKKVFKERRRKRMGERCEYAWRYSFGRKVRSFSQSLLNHANSARKCKISLTLPSSVSVLSLYCDLYRIRCKQKRFLTNAIKSKEQE